MTRNTPQPTQRTASAKLIPRANDIDPRCYAFRPDLADLALYGKVGAQRYAEPVPFFVCASVANLYDKPGSNAEQTSQLLHGEIFNVLELGESWAWGQCLHDGYVGYVERCVLSNFTEDATHWVWHPQALAFHAPSIKSAAPLLLPRGARVRVIGEEGDFFALSSGTFMRRSTVRLQGEWLDNLFDAAYAMLHTPYLWGGRTRAGIDCSGLIQSAFQACGMACPRDSDQQQAFPLGQMLAQFGNAQEALNALPKLRLRQGDLLFMPGHVGMLADGTQLLHANAYHMTTLIEPLAHVLERQARSAPSPLSYQGQADRGTGRITFQRTLV